MPGTYAGVSTAGNVVALPQAILDVYSLDIEHSALPIMRYEEFAVKKTELGADPGQNIIFTQYADIEGGGELQEDKDMEEQHMSASRYSITVTEFGNAIGVREKLLQMARDDQLEEAAYLLGRNYAKVLDRTLRNVVDSCTNLIYSGEKAARNLLTVDDLFDVGVIRRAVEILQTNEAPKFNADFYICFCHPHQAAGLSKDPEWVAANNYANTRALFNGELGRWQDVVFISTTMQRNGAAAVKHVGYDPTMVAASSDGKHVYRAAFMGEGGYGHAIGLPVQMRDNGVKDYGRKHGLAWYSIMGTGVLHDEYMVLAETT